MHEMFSVVLCLFMLQIYLNFSCVSAAYSVQDSMDKDRQMQIWSEQHQEVGGDKEMALVITDSILTTILEDVSKGEVSIEQAIEKLDWMKEHPLFAGKIQIDECLAQFQQRSIQETVWDLLTSQKVPSSFELRVVNEAIDVIYQTVQSHGVTADMAIQQLQGLNSIVHLEDRIRDKIQRTITILKLESKLEDKPPLEVPSVDEYVQRTSQMLFEDKRHDDE